MKVLVVLPAMVLVLGFTPMLLAGNLWQDNFDDNSLDNAYITPSGGNGAGDPEWVEEEGVAK